MRKNFTSSPARINIALGLDWNDPKYCKKNIIPKISSMKYLRSLPPNTAGGHLAKFFNKWTLTIFIKIDLKKKLQKLICFLMIE